MDTVAQKKTRKNRRKPLTVEQMWALMSEIGEAQKKSEVEFEELRKYQKEVWASIKEVQKNIGGINNTLGDLTESLMKPALHRKFDPFGFTFDRITTVTWARDPKNPFLQIDALLENGKQAMAVEIKTRLAIKDINEHIKRMEKIHKYAAEHKDKRQFFAAMAAMIINDKSRAYALAQRLYLIEPAGEDIKVTVPDAEPKMW